MENLYVDIGAQRVNGYVTLYVAHSFMAIMWRGYFSSWDALENEVNESKSGSICIGIVC